VEPLKREFWTVIHKAIQDEISGRKPGRGQWRKRKKLERSQNSGKQIILDGDALSTPYVPVGTKGN
jgi:hypothetical protein